MCTLGIGTACDDSVLTGTNSKHSVSALTNEKCTLIRVKRDMFRELWEQNLQFIENNSISPVDNNLNYSFSACLPSKLPIRSYSQSCSSISGRDQSSPENIRTNMLAVDFKEANNDILTASSRNSSIRNSFSSQNTETNLFIDFKARHLSEGQIDKLDQSIKNREQLNPLFQNQSSSSTNLKSTALTFNQPINNLEQLSQPINQIIDLRQNQQPQQQQQQTQQQQQQDAFSKRKSFRRSTLRRSSYRTTGSSAYEESDLNATIVRVAKVLRTLIQFKAAYLIRDRCLESPIVNYETANANNNKNYNNSSSFPPTQRDIFTRCMVGSEMVDWLLSISANTTLRLHSRFQAASMWQV